MTARFTTDPPLASADTWAGRQCSRAIAPRMPSDRLAAPAAPLHKGQATGSRQLAIDDHLCGSAAAAADTWAGRSREAQIEAIWRGNMSLRAKAAKDYGEPETPHEFYAGRPGSRAEVIVLDCLRELRAIPEADRLYAHELTDAISRVYLETAKVSAVRMRRIAALLRIGAEPTS